MSSEHGIGGKFLGFARLICGRIYNCLGVVERR
jgi:hypothetical protein